MIINPDTIRDDTSTFTQFLAVETVKLLRTKQELHMLKLGNPVQQGQRQGWF